MAAPIQGIGRRIGEPRISAGSNNAFAMLGDSMSRLATLANKALDPVAEKVLAAEAMKDRIELYDEQKDLAPGELPENKGGFNPLSITKWGRMYGDAYSEIDGQVLAAQGNQAMAELALVTSDPRNLGPGSTAYYEAESEAIVRGVTAAATPKAKAAVFKALQEKATQYQTKVATAERTQSLNNAKSMADYAAGEIKLEMIDAAFRGNQETFMATKEALDANILDQASLNLISSGQAQQLLANNDSDAKIYSAVGHYRSLLIESKDQADEWQANLAKSPPEDMTVAEWQQTLKLTSELSAQHEGAIREAQSSQYSQMMYGIDTDIIDNPEQLAHFDLLDTPQLLAGQSAIYKRNQQSAKFKADTTYAYEKINQGQGAMLPTSLVTNLFNGAADKTRELKGEPLNLRDNSQILLGEGNVIPASGTRGVSLGTDVAAFNNQLSTQLSSQSPGAMAEAAEIVNYHNEIKKQPQTIKLSDKDLLIATNITAMMDGGMSGEEAATIVSKVMLDKSDLRTQERAVEFDSTDFQDKLPGLFDEVFGERPDSETNYGAYNKFKLQLRNYYASGSSIEGALKAIKANMYDYGTSEFFPDNRVYRQPPDKLPIAQMGFALKNEHAIETQKFIDRNPQFRWAKESDAIDIGSLTDEQKVLFPLPAVINERGAAQEALTSASEAELSTLFPGVRAASMAINAVTDDTKLPTIMVTDMYGEHESPVFLTSDESLRYNAKGAPTYVMSYRDRFGSIQPLTDTKTGEVVMFQPRDLKEFAPAMYSKEASELARNALQAYSEAPAKAVASERRRDYMLSTMNPWAAGANVLIKTVTGEDAGTRAQGSAERLKALEEDAMKSASDRFKSRNPTGAE